MRLRGCFTAIVTPFTAAGTVDEAALAAHANWMVEEGVAGIVACGTTGESVTLSAQESQRVVNVVAEAVNGRATVIAGVGSNNTAASIERVQAICAETRADAIMSVVPYYNKPNQAGIVAHFEALLRAATKPMVAYNVPGRTVVGMSAETMQHLARHPGVVAIKEASADLMLDTATLDGLDESCALLSGDDGTTYPFLALGGHGSVSVVSNVAPRLMAQLCDAVERADLKRARTLHAHVARWHHLLFSAPNPLPTKIVTEQLGFGSADVRLPHVRLDEATERSIADRAATLLANDPTSAT